MRVLNMIVKNESAVIERCLDSMKSFIDAVVISDTGSTDNTIEIMEKWRTNNGKSGVIISNEWKNFEHNRNLALNSCIDWIRENSNSKDNYIIFIDADDYVVITDEESFRNEITQLDSDKHFINMYCGSSEYGRLFTVKVPNSIEEVCKWEGVLHECMNRQGTCGKKITGAHIQASREGARSMDPMKYLKDALVLEADLKINPTSTRNVFYLAQSYRDYGGDLFKQMAEKLYIKRFDMGGFKEESYISLVEAAKCRIARGKDDHKAIDLLIRAFEFRSHRLEAPYHLVRLYRRKGRPNLGYTFGKSLLTLPYPKNELLFVDKSIHQWMFYDEVAICATWVPDRLLYRSLCEKILAIPSLPEGDSLRITRDLEIFGK